MTVSVNPVQKGHVMEEKNDRQVWLDAGLQTLVEEGVEGLRIMSIAKRLGVTKGSFYWHFKNLEAYQCALLAEWERRYTQAPIEAAADGEASAYQQLRSLFCGTPAMALRLGRAMRAWAITDDRVHAVQTRVDHQRVGHVAHLLEAIGWTREESLTLGRWAYCAFIGEAALTGSPMSDAQTQLVLSVLTPRRLG
ncbi:TetR/AcrR family transcriptional regulator [Duganella sp. HH105]|uniref:TetR/AcrR family transcriptional regulator n=1 Tax=Duganella sp. HH105 TaxID=1781067 RepID=UPI000893FF46|nr:TetR/AcrR family transcriptional regulator [Duganella sp. HH105]OEZ58598.1 putative HTH-type transcriptional regulator TtgW [Duganella sp. HH105]